MQETVEIVTTYKSEEMNMRPVLAAERADVCRAVLLSIFPFPLSTPPQT